MWQQAFFKLAAAAGVPVDPSAGQSPEAVIQHAQAARHRDPYVQVRRNSSTCCAGLMLGWAAVLASPAAQHGYTWC